MQELNVRIRRVTDDLQAIETELNAAAQADAPPRRREEIMRQLADTAMLNAFKGAVDHMRHLLWSYIEASSKKDKDVAQTLQAVRMQRVTEMLKILAPTVDEDAKSTPEGESFLDLVNQIAQKTVDRHEQRDK